MADYVQEFERRAKDAGYAGDDAKVMLAASLNEQTLIRLDTYVTASFPGQIQGTETMMERLARIPYNSMLNFLKQSSLLDLANQAAGGTKLPTNANVSAQSPPSAPAPRESAAPSGAGAASSSGGFLDTGIFTMTPEAGSPAAGSDGKPAGRKGGRGGRVGGRKDKGKVSGYQPVEVPAHDELMKVYTSSLAMADQAFPPSLCKNPLPMLAAVIGVLNASEASTALPDESK